jgi:hypothetical protein
MSTSKLLSALGREPATSARPPVLIKGYTSDEANQTLIFSMAFIPLS